MRVHFYQHRIVGFVFVLIFQTRSYRCFTDLTSRITRGKLILRECNLAISYIVCVTIMASSAPTYEQIISFNPEESSDYYLKMLLNLPAAVYTCDADGYVKFYNKAAVDLWGREPQIGKDLWCGSWKIYNAGGVPMALHECPMAVALKEKRAVFNEEVIIERPGGEKRYVLPHPQPIFDTKGALVGAINMLVDISENKSIREHNNKLRLYNEQLEQFAFAASHDLQEPLRKINAFATLLLKQNYNGLDDTGLKYLHKISDSSSRMMNLISDLLAYTKDANVNTLLEKTDLNETVENIKSDLEFLIFEKKAIIEADWLPAIKAVPSQMNRLFYNLINNSLKFSRQGIAPVIKINYQRSSSYIKIIVSDNGIGFQPEHAEKIFTLFQRLNDRHSYPGSGIGLSLCKKIVEMHGGEIFAVSEVGHGAAFHIKLPASLLLE